ncbi:MAG TPA: hypothetical protein VFY24_06195 [Azospira sp.]|nr:hypothetical protein [Azospira sp.]
MKRQLGWQRVSREAVAQHLREVDILGSEAVGDASVYHCRDQNGESMAISLPGDSGLIISLKGLPSPALERRRRRRGGNGDAPA